MILVKFQDTKGKYWPLRSIKSVTLSLHNKNSILNGIKPHGWQNSLEMSGDKYLIVKINGIVSGSQSEDILHECALENRTIACQILFGYEMEKRIDAKYLIELYEKHCEAGNLDNFTIRLSSSGKVLHQVLH